MTSTLKRLSGSPTISVGNKQRTITNYGTPKITATIPPAMSTIYAGSAVQDVTNWAAFIDDRPTGGNYTSPVGTIASVDIAFLGNAASASDPLADGETAGFTITVTDSAGTVKVFTADAIAITAEPPVIATAPTLSGAAVRGEQLTGTAGTFGGGTGTVTHRWQVSDNGVTDWADTGTTGLTGPAMTAAKYYRLVSRSTNSGATVDNPSAARGPAVTPTISIPGLTGGEAVIGGTFAIVASAGTVTARKWGTSAGGTELGTGTSPTSLTGLGGQTLHATATIGGFDYAAFAPIQGASSVITATVQPAMSQLAAGQAMQDVLNWSLFQNVNNYQSSGGTIVAPVVVGYTGDAVDATTALAEGNLAGFTITVTDSTAAEKVFTAAQITVSGAEAVIINSMVAETYDGVGEIPAKINAQNVVDGNSVYLVLVPSAATAPIEAEIKAGQASGGGAPSAYGSGTWPPNIAMTVSDGLLRGSYRLYAVINNGQDSNVGVSNSFLCDTTGATVSDATAVVNGTNVDCRVTSNDDVGTITGRLYLASATPTDEEVYAGTGAVDSFLIESPAADDSNTGTFITPDAGNYKFYAFAIDDFGQKSNIVVSATVSPGGSTIIVTPIGTIRSSTATDQTNFGEVVNASDVNTDPVPGRELVIEIAYAESAGGTGVTVTVDSLPATQKNVQNPAIQANTGIWTYDVSAGGTFAVEIDPSTAWRSYEVMMYFVDGHSSITGYGASNTSYAAMDVSAAVNNGSEVIGCVAQSNYNTTGDVALTGLTDVGGSQGLNTSKKNTFLRATSTANETREMIVTPNGNGSGNVATSIVVIS